MTNPMRNGEWRLYLRDHKWWWKWPLVATTMGVWIGAMFLFVAPWQSNASIDLSQPEPVTTTDNDESATVGDRGTTFAGDPIVLDDASTETATPKSDGTEVKVVSLSPETPTDTEVPTDTAASEDDQAEETDVARESRRRPTVADRAEEPQPEPTTVDTVAVTTAPPAPTTTVRPPVAHRPTITPTTTTTTIRPTTTTTTVRPTTTTTTVRPTTTTASATTHDAAAATTHDAAAATTATDNRAAASAATHDRATTAAAGRRRLIEFEVPRISRRSWFAETTSAVTAQLSHDLGAQARSMPMYAISSTSAGRSGTAGEVSIGATNTSSRSRSAARRSAASSKPSTK